MSAFNQTQKDRLMNDLHAVVAEAEGLLRATAGSVVKPIWLLTIT